METETDSRAAFVQNRLPWLIGAGALVVYLVTMTRWVTYLGMPSMARVTGWDWHLIYNAPLYFLVTYPIRWLPSGWQVFALNVLAAACAAAALGLLARAVAILPHDRTRAQRQLERSDYSFLSIPAAWLPPIFAVLVCGLQITFWEHATVATGEAFDLLLFAYVVRCLLEHRIELKDGWLYRAALVYGLGMTNNLALVGSFPAFMIAVVWVKGLTFFNHRFIVRMALLGLAGLSLYLLLPIVLSASELTDQTFWEILRVNLGFQKMVLLNFPRYLIAIMGLTSLLPVLVIGIRWPAQAGDISVAGTFLSTVMTHVIHGMFLLACLYVAFDEKFSPRVLAPGWYFLPLYYLGALCVGYFSGYFLLIFGAKPTKAWERPSLLERALSRALVALVWIGFVAVPMGLLYRNYPELRRNLNPHLAQFGHAAAQSLPQGAVVLSDDTFTLNALHAALDRAGSSREYVLVDSRSLPQPAYHRHMRKTHGPRWPALPFDAPLSERLSDPTIANLIVQLSRSNAVYYLHPSFGYFFEHFYAHPRQLVYEIKPLATDSLVVPPLTAEELRDTDAFLKKLKDEQLGGVIRLRRGRDDDKPSQSAVLSGAIYSRVYNYFGVELQKAGQLEKAREYFASALELNPDNPSAFINQDYNALLLTGQKESGDPSEGAKKRLGPYGGNWNAILSDNGPIDEPNARYLLAQTFARGRNFRQAAMQLLRVLELMPGNLLAKLALSSIYVEAQLPERALRVIADIRALPEAKGFSVAQQISLIQTEAWAHYFKNDVPTAEKLLLAAQEKYPNESGPFSTLAGIYRTMNRLTNAIVVLEQQLKLQPDNVDALITLGAHQITQGDLAGAIRNLDRALELNPDHAGALLNRAIANLNLGRLDEAKRDYVKLEGKLPKPLYAVYYGLAWIAEQKKNHKEALENYERYLKLAPPGTPESNWVRDRVKVLKSGSL
jgi:tetratricopeptide (TPR) repeat protein